MKARFLNGRGTAAVRQPCGVRTASSGGGRLMPAVEKEDNFFGSFDCLLLLGHPQLGQNKCVDSLV